MVKSVIANIIINFLPKCSIHIYVNNRSAKINITNTLFSLDPTSTLFSTGALGPYARKQTNLDP